MTIDINDMKYKIIKDEREAFDKEEFEKRYTPFFDEYDYIVGDIAYSQLRLKGFNKKTNKQYNKINDYSNLDKYLRENCAYSCKYFVLEKISNNNTKK